MDIDLSALHFLRPLWLLLILPGIALPIIWAHRHDLNRQLRGAIAPHLLKHLVIKPQDNQRLRPVHLLAALLILGAIAAAGPTWQQDRPDFLDDRAPLILAVDLSPSMDADDVPPTRLSAVRHKLHDLIERRAGARTALIAYAGSAHLVLPATDDPALLDTFLQALSTGLINKAGHDVLGVIDQAKRLLEAEKSPGTLVLITDGADPALNKQIDEHLKGVDLQVLVLAVGSKPSIVVRNAQGQPQVDADGRPVVANFDSKALQALADAANAPLGSLTLNDDDLDWIELHAQRHFQAISDQGKQIHWKDAGYWLCWPLLLIALFCVRRGWRVHWLASLVLAFGLGLPAAPAQAGALADAFFTADQQGRWAFEHQRYPQAAARFSDPYWKGVAAYNAADYDAVLVNFANQDSAQAFFYMGNSYVRLFRFPEAISAYQHALKLQPEFPQATSNLALAQALQKDYENQQEAGTPDEKPDEIKFDNKSDQGKDIAQPVAKAASDQLWLDNLTTSPARFLKQKFALQDAKRQQETEASP
ncbi:VWA domain-containing protein [Pseudomonas segetis]|uniref:Ca-activated chloride channel family protein n=1 Tax=Pseudomonas segetis TaxID=298908 RepID=A0A238ZEA7_9PSED|nr:VWA domain-containing protein [Pseudomonas segetis]SNR81620.1 Ca-activated chloride channel family protein [Pseudomonas segetis]